MSANKTLLTKSVSLPVRAGSSALFVCLRLRDRQTDRRQTKSSLNASALWGGRRHIIKETENSWCEALFEAGRHSYRSADSVKVPNASEITICGM